MVRPLKITYLFESTTLWGGTKAAFEQAEALFDAGHDITIVSKDSGPDWYPLKLSVVPSPNLDAAAIPESDIIVGTFWPTVKTAYESGKGIAVHLCQGYEGACKEYHSVKAEIDKVYSYRIPKLTVSPHMNGFLKERFGAETYFIGHMLNREIFHPSENKKRENTHGPLTILVVGPFEADVKNIPSALKGIALAVKMLSIPVKLVRASQFPLTSEEKTIIEPDVYHFHVPYHAMGEIYRNVDLLVSMSKEEEGFGLPALEAMGCGVPVILSKISSYTSFDMPLDYALFVDPSDYRALAEAIVELFHNRPLRIRLKQRGLVVADKFTKEKMVNRMERAFEEIKRTHGRSKLKRALLKKFSTFRCSG